MNNEPKKKPFDSTVCFTFYGSWKDAISKFESDTDKLSPAYQLFDAIASYSLYGTEPEFQTDNAFVKIGLEAVWSTIVGEIDSSLSRRKRGFSHEEPTEAQTAIINELIKRPEASLRDIAAATGTSKSAVERTKKRYAKRIESGVITLNEKSCPAEDGDKRGTEDDKIPYNEIEEGGELPF